MSSMSEYLKTVKVRSGFKEKLSNSIRRRRAVIFTDEARPSNQWTECKRIGRKFLYELLLKNMGF